MSNCLTRGAVQVAASGWQQRFPIRIKQFSYEQCMDAVKLRTKARLWKWGMLRCMLFRAQDCGPGPERWLQVIPSKLLDMVWVKVRCADLLQRTLCQFRNACHRKKVSALMLQTVSANGSANRFLAKVDVRMHNTSKQSRIAGARQPPMSLSALDSAVRSPRGVGRLMRRLGGPMP